MTPSYPQALLTYTPVRNIPRMYLPVFSTQKNCHISAVS